MLVVVLALDVIVRRVGDRAGEVERLLALLGDDRGGDRDIVFAGADAGEDAGPGQDLLLDLERRVLRKSSTSSLSKPVGLPSLTNSNGRKSSSVATISSRAS